MDIAMAGMGGIEAIKRLVARHPQVRVLALSAHEDTSYSKRAFQAGALGYLSKRTAPEVLIDAIRLVAQGKRFIDPGIAQRMAMQDLSGESDPLAQLSPREFEVFMQIARGQSVVAVAETLNLSVLHCGHARPQNQTEIGFGERFGVHLVGFAPGPDRRLGAGCVTCLWTLNFIQPQLE
jgi:two-component system invasion response regulator UvrY